MLKTVATGSCHDYSGANSHVVVLAVVFVNLFLFSRLVVDDPSVHVFIVNTGDRPGGPGFRQNFTEIILHVLFFL